MNEPSRITSLEARLRQCLEAARPVPHAGRRTGYAATTHELPRSDRPYWLATMRPRRRVGEARDGGSNTAGQYIRHSLGDREREAAQIADDEHPKAAGRR